MRDSIETTISHARQESLASRALRLGVPKSTLGHRENGRVSRSKGHAGQMALSEPEEEALVASIERLCEWNWAPTKAHIKSMVDSLIEARGDHTRLNIDKNWVDRFLKRFPTLMTTWSEVQSSVRLAASKPELIYCFLKRFQVLCVKHDVQVDDFWNFNEKGVQASKVYCLRLVVRCECLCFDKQRRMPSDRVIFTLVECCFVTGKTCRPFVIIPATETQVEWANDQTVSGSKWLKSLFRLLII